MFIEKKVVLGDVRKLFSKLLNGIETLVKLFVSK